MQPVRVTLVPLVLAAAALFVVLPRSGGDATLRIAGADGSYAFEPGELDTAEDARILVRNETDATHTVTAVAGGFDLEIQPGDSRFLEIAEPGAYEYFCRYHATSEAMSGTITLGDPNQEPAPAPTVVSTSVAAVPSAS